MKEFSSECSLMRMTILFLLIKEKQLSVTESLTKEFALGTGKLP